MWLFRIFSSIVFLTVIVLAIPLAFDVGGRTCGLAFSLSLASFYFGFSVLRLSTPDASHVRYGLIQFIRWSQWLIVPSLLIWSLGRFSVDAESRGWVEKTFRTTKARDASIAQWLFGPDGLVESVTLSSWDKLLRWSTPVFQLAEGFCSLLVIQAAGQLTRWLVNRGERSDSWMIGLLVFSASVISSSLYFLWRVLQFPDVSHVDSLLIGVAIASAFFLCAWGIISGRGNAVESSLLLAYIVLCIYQIFTDYKPSDPTSTAEAQAQAASTDFPPFPPIIMASYTTLMDVLSTLPSTILAAINFITAAFATVTPSVLISLAYRLFVLYASTRIIPAVNESGASGLSKEPTLEDTNGANQFLAFLSWFSPSILIAVYTSLLMQHFSTTIGPEADISGGFSSWWQRNNHSSLVDGNLWKWINLAGTMGLYAVELWLGQEDDIDGGHWKVD